MARLSSIASEPAVSDFTVCVRMPCRARLETPIRERPIVMEADAKKSVDGKKHRGCRRHGE
jgi:hypothetical protein